MSKQAHLLIQEFRLSPGAEWTSQAPNWWFLCVIDGESYWLGPQNPRSLAAGEALIIAPTVPAVIRASQLTEVVLKGFAFAPEDLLGLLTLAERKNFANALTANSNHVHFLPSIHLVARRLSTLVPAPPGCEALRQRAETLAIVAAVFDTKASMSHSSDGHGISARQRFRRLVTEVSEVDLIHSAPAELALLCRCSTSYFGRLFREHFGAPVRAMQEELRLLRACQLLRATASDIAAIAQSCGFDNPQTLNLLFKTRFGVWPSQWRQQQQGSERLTATTDAAAPARAQFAANPPVQPSSVADS